MTSRRQFLAAIPGMGLATAGSVAGQQAGDGGRSADRRVPLEPADDGAFKFETDALVGLIQPNGAYHGVTRLTDKRTGRQWIDERYSALNLFKLQSVNHCMGQPRENPREIAVSEKSVAVRWPATEAHRGEIVATYEVLEPDIIECTVSVRIAGAYAGYEVFMSSYFEKSARPNVYLKSRFANEPDQRVTPGVNDVFRNCLLVFPRDSNAAQLCVDGRWDRSEGGVPVVQNIPVRHYARCLAFFSDPEQTSAVTVMSHPRDAYALSTRYHADNEEDRQTSYSAVDFSLCGQDLADGDVRTMRVRMALTELDEPMSQPTELYAGYLLERDQAGADR